MRLNAHGSRHYNRRNGSNQVSTIGASDKDDVVHACSGDDLATKKRVCRLQNNMVLMWTVLSEKSDGHCTSSFIRESKATSKMKGKMKELTEQSRGHGGTWGGERHKLCGALILGRVHCAICYSERLVMTVNGSNL